LKFEVRKMTRDTFVMLVKNLKTKLKLKRVGLLKFKVRKKKKEGVKVEKSIYSRFKIGRYGGRGDNLGV